MKRLIVLLSLILTGTSFGQIPVNGLVSRYSFSGNANDVSGNGNNGVVHGATLVYDRFGSPNSAFRFNGTSSYIEIPHSSSLATIRSGLTISAWVRVDPDKRQYANALVTKGIDDPSTYTPDWSFMIYDVPGAGMLTRPHAYLAGAYQYFDGSSILQLGRWYHVVMTYDGARIRSWVDGVQDGVREVAGLLQVTNSTLRLGVYDLNGAPGWFAGDLDDILIYDHALTAQEISSIYLDRTASLKISVLDVEGWGPLRSTGQVTLYNGQGYPVKSALTDGNGAVSFQGIPAGTGYSYTVTNTKPVQLGPCLWGVRQGLDLLPRDSLSETFTRNMPYAKTVRVFDQATGTEVTGGVVARGTPVRVVLQIATPNTPGSSTHKVGGTILLDRDYAAPIDYSWTTPPGTDLIPGGSPVDLEYLVTLQIPGVYYYNVAAVSIVDGIERTTDATEWSPPLLIVANGSNGEYVPNASTVGLWHMNEPSGGTIADASTHANHATTDSASVDGGKFGLGRKFNGRTARVTVPPSASMSWTTTKALSFEAWVNPDDLRHQAIAIKGEAASYPFPNEWAVVLEPDGTVRFKVNADASNLTYSYLTSTRTIRTRSWNHIACIWDGTAGTMTMYVNGAMAGTRAAISSMVTLADKGLVFGFVGDGPFKGVLDEVLVSNAVRLPSQFNLQLPPGNVQAEPGPGTVSLSWTMGGGAVDLLRYRIYRGDDSTNLSVIDSTTNLLYVDHAVASGKTYCYRLAAVDLTGFESGFTPATQAAPLPNVPAIVVTLPVRSVQKGTSIEIPVNVGTVTGKNILSYQFTLKYSTPQPILTIQKDLVVLGTLSAQSGWSVTANTDTAGQITVGAFGATPLSGSGALLILKGQIAGNAATSQAADLVTPSFLFNAGDPAASVVPGKLTVSATVCGDADLNGSIQAYDAALTVRDAIGIAPLATQAKINADVDLNGLVQAFDAALILRNAIGLPPPGGVTTCFAGMGKGSSLLPTLTGLSPSLSWTGMRSGRSVARLRFAGEDVPDLLALTFTLEASATQEGEWTIRPVDPPSAYLMTIHHPAAGKWTFAAIHPVGITLKDIIIEIEAADPSLLRTLKLSSPLANATPLPEVDLAASAEEAMPSSFSLVSGYPNPFNPSTTIVFDMPIASPVTIEIYDVLGVMVKTLYTGTKELGRHTVKWDGTNEDGRMVATGQYYCRMKAGDYVGTIRLMLLK